MMPRNLLAPGGADPPLASRAPEGAWHGVVGRSSAMRDLFAAVEAAARDDSPVLVVGERGTGRETIARAIHAAGPRASRRFVAIDCAVVPSDRLDAELFGPGRGAPAGDRAQRAGLFDLAGGGTLFLDGICEASPAVQAKLARVLDAGVARPKTAPRGPRPRVRLVAATHRDLRALVAQGVFREDLAVRLGAGAVRVPPLRERKGDVALLADHFLSTLPCTAGRAWEWTDDAMEALGSYRWPGNVRELRDSVERAALASPDGRIARAALPAEIADATGEVDGPPSDGIAAQPYRTALLQVRADGVRRYLEAALVRAGGSVTRAAEQAGVERESFYRLCRRHDVRPAAFRRRGPHNGAGPPAPGVPS